MITAQSILAIHQMNTCLKMSKLYVLLICVLKIVLSQKCSSVFDAKNVFKTMNCVNLLSMVDIAEEIRENWTSITVINKASHTKFNNNAGRVFMSFRVKVKILN